MWYKKARTAKIWNKQKIKHINKIRITTTDALAKSFLPGVLGFFLVFGVVGRVFIVTISSYSCVKKDFSVDKFMLLSPVVKRPGSVKLSLSVRLYKNWAKNKICINFKLYQVYDL